MTATVQARGQGMVGDMVTGHVAAAAGAGGVFMAAVYGVVEDISVPSVGVGAAGAFLLGLVGLLFRQQQQQIKQQAARIASLEHELDVLRLEAMHAMRRADASARRADGMQTEITDLGMRPDNRG